jgi:hypothetical protein
VGAGALIAQRPLDEQETRHPRRRGDLPAEVILTTSAAPDAASCSAINTANGAPTAMPTTPISIPSRSTVHMSV